MATKDQVETLTNLLIQSFGATDWYDDSPAKTAERVLRAWAEFKPEPLPDFEFTAFPAVANQLIVVRDIQFSSLCAHHLFPYYGVAHVGYIPNELMIGLSKIPRLVKWKAKRPSTQEALTKNVASELKHRLAAMGVAVVIEARHTCMACRGVEAHDASMATSEMRGVFLTSSEARQEFLSLINKKGV